MSLPPANKEARRAKQMQIMKAVITAMRIMALQQQEVSEACGCNVASIYQYFENSMTL